MSSSANSPGWALEWNEGLSVFIPEIDAEHKYFLKLVNELNSAISQRRAVAEVVACMQAILDNAEAHFAHEERLFVQSAYPKAAEHAAEHARLLRQLDEIRRQIEHGGVEFALIEAGLKVKAALVGHLLADDMQYRNYFQSQRG
jgi:hemerythrin-like metal-binding protein